MLFTVALIALLAVVRAGLISDPGPRIAGLDGYVISDSVFPYQVSLRYKDNFICAGALYKEDIVLTAAHCVKGIPTSSLTVVAGSTNSVQISGEPFKGIFRNVASIRMHPTYNSDSYDYDIAIVSLSNKYTLSDYIKPIKLASSIPAAESDVFLTGWGSLNEKDDPRPLPGLQLVSLKINGKDKCIKKHGSNKITSKMICAGIEDGGKGACWGDSGSPLIRYNSGVTELVGIFIRSYGCGRKGYPDIYSNVVAVKSWIEQNSK